MQRVLGLVGGCVLAIGGAVGAGNEVRAHMTAVITPTQTLIASEPRGYVRAFSYRARKAQLDRCITDRHDLVFDVFPEDLARRMIGDCIRLAEFNHSIAPSQSRAHLSDALQSASLNDREASLRSIIYARAGAPNSYPLTLRRVDAILRLARTRGDIADETSLASDVAVLLREGKHLQDFVAVYASHPVHQPWILRQIEQAEPAAQRRFVNAMREVAAHD